MLPIPKGLVVIADKPVGLALLIVLHLAVCCISLVYASYASYFAYPHHFNAPTYHIFFDAARLPIALAVVGTFACVGFLFAAVEFSFGYFVGFYLYTLILNYLWLNCFSDLTYNHQLASLSAATSIIAFLLPALLISGAVPRSYSISVRALEHILSAILLVAIVTIAIGAFYNFRIVDLGHVYDFRNNLQFPTAISYLIGVTSTTLLPFAFACFVFRSRYWKAGSTLVLLLLFYPITLNKFAFFAPAWLLVVLLISRMFAPRTSVILSLVLPILVGVLFVVFHAYLPEFLYRWGAQYFFWANFRVVAVPGTAMDIYNDFFSRHDLTYFCQIWVLKPLMTCPYLDPLSIVMERNYGLGNFNASLFATEGVASVGLFAAPASALLCGLIIALGNCASKDLPSSFVLISGGVLPHILLNVPLSTVMLTHGAGLLFLLWYITPRTAFKEIDAD